MKRFRLKIYFAVLALLASLTASAYHRYDVNQDNKVDITDLTSIIDYLLSAEYAEQLQEPQVETFTIRGVSFNMVTVQGGTFTMGATFEQGSDAASNENHAHEVTLSTYRIGQTEVTQELYAAVTQYGYNPSTYKDPKFPMDNLTYAQWQEFISKLNQLTGMNFRMPTEAEWEFAARGGNRSTGCRYSGSNDINKVAWLITNTAYNKAYGTVGSRQPNELGIYDMSGSVDEWCQDWYRGYYSSLPQVNPTGPDYGDSVGSHVIRGGNGYNTAISCRVSRRFCIDFDGDNPGRTVGLRLAL